MEKLTNRILVLAFVVTLPLFTQAGGGWPKKKGTGYYKLSEWWIVADQHYTSTGLIDPNVTSAIFNTSLYAEYGFTDRLTSILYFPFFSRALQNDVVSGTTGAVTTEGEAINTVGDTNLGFKYGLSGSGSKYSVAATLTFGLPLGENAGGSNGALQTGDGEFNQLIQLDVSRSFSIGKLPIYGNVYTGFNNRTEKFSDEFRLGAELGLSLAQTKLWLIGRLDVVESLKNGLTAAEGVAINGVFSNNTEFAAVTMEAAYYLTEKFGFSAAVGGAFRGEIILARPSYSVGLFLDWK